LSAFELKNVILLYGKIMLEKAKKKASDFLVMEASRKIFQSFCFGHVWRRGGVIEFASGNCHVENEDGKKIHCVEVSKNLLSYQTFYDPHK
jgi:hypothetical protein